MSNRSNSRSNKSNRSYSRSNKSNRTHETEAIHPTFGRAVLL